MPRLEQVGYIPTRPNGVCAVCGHTDEHRYPMDGPWPPVEVGCNACPDETCVLPKGE